MAKQKLTPWFPATVKPARPGVYEVKSILEHPRTYYSVFDGMNWNGAWWTPERAVSNGHRDEAFIEREWRGLAENPHA